MKLGAGRNQTSIADGTGVNRESPIPRMKQSLEKQLRACHQSAIPNSNGNIEYRHDLVFMNIRDINLISEFFCIPSSNLGLLESSVTCKQT